MQANIAQTNDLQIVVKIYIYVSFTSFYYKFITTDQLSLNSKPLRDNFGV